MAESPKRQGPPVPDPNWELELHGPAAAPRKAGPDSKDPMLAHALLRAEPDPLDIDFDLEIPGPGRPSPPFPTGPGRLDELSDLERTTSPPPEAMNVHVARMMAQAQLIEDLDDEGDRPTPLIDSERLPLLPPNGLVAQAPEPAREVRPGAAPRGVAVRFGSDRKETPLVRVDAGPKPLAPAAREPATRATREPATRARVSPPGAGPDISDLPAVFSFDGLDEPATSAPPFSEPAISPAVISSSLAAAPVSEPAISPPFASLDSLDLAEEPPDLRSPSAEMMSAIEARLVAGDYGRALMLAESALAAHPGDPALTRHAEGCREMMYRRYVERLGAGDHVPRVAMQRSALTGLQLDHRAGFLLACVDGVSTVEEIIDVSAMPRLDAVRILHELMQEGVIEMVAPR